MAAAASEEEEEEELVIMNDWIKIAEAAVSG